MGRGLGAPPAARPAAAAAVGRLLRDAGYTEAGIQALLRTRGTQLVAHRDLPVYRLRLEGDYGPLATLVRLFLLDFGVDPAVAERALGDGLAELDALGLVHEVDGSLRGRVRLIPWSSLVLAADVPSRDAHPDHVAAVHPPSQLLASLTVRRPVRTALDVGTGNGVQALLLAAHADRVVATDVSERALAFAAFNAALNGVENVELRLGSFLEPVEGERFGVAVANPPYVISPEAEYVFRDAGLGRDRVSEELVRAFPAVLEEGAFGSVMLSWIEDGDGDPPHAWLEGARCDAFLFRTRPQDPLDAAAAWNAGVPDKERERRIVRWLDYFARERIDAIAYGTLVLRRRAERGWFRSARLPEGPSEPAGEHLELLFANQDALLALDDEQLLERRVVVAPHTLFEHVNASGDGGWTTTEAALAVRAGIRFRATLDAPSAGFVAALDPTLPLREVIAAAAAARGVPEPEFAPPALATVRHLLELGFAALAPVPVPGAPPPLAPA